MQLDVVGLGICTLDHLLVVPRPPTFERGTRVTAYGKQGGGPVATAMVALACLGARAGFVGRVGNDEAGQFIKADFDRYSVDTSHLSIQPGAISHTIFVLVDQNSGERSFSGWGPTISPLRSEDLDRGYITACKFLHLDSASETSIAAAKWAKEAGVKVSYDAGGFSEASLKLMELVDVAITSKYFAEKFMGDRTPEELYSIGSEIAIVTQGEHGCIGVDASGAFHQPAFKVSQVVDTTGAGDVFHGAFIYALLKDQDAREAARFASAAAAIKCTRLGGRAGIPNLSQVERFLSTHG
jgi:sugar/nucleoside kinase (ribokinase family)